MANLNFIFLADLRVGIKRNRNVCGPYQRAKKILEYEGDNRARHYLSTGRRS